MPIALPDDLRWRIIWMHYYKRIGCKDIAELLFIHISTVYRIIDRYRADETVAPFSYRSSPTQLLRSPEEFSIVESLMARPEIYLEELQRELYVDTGVLARFYNTQIRLHTEKTSTGSIAKK